MGAAGAPVERAQDGGLHAPNECAAGVHDGVDDPVWGDPGLVALRGMGQVGGVRESDDSSGGHLPPLPPFLRPFSIGTSVVSFGHMHLQVEFIKDLLNKSGTES